MTAVFWRVGFRRHQLGERIHEAAGLFESIPAAALRRLLVPSCRNLPRHPDVEAWGDLVARDGGLFHRLIGKVHRLRLPTWPAV